ncbi:MAG: ATP-binding cassette domain-containing protein [Proteobacteria bacterium]|nr:ATP-binding cassette domain-containing protein [Pseudomonadota bacterium]
MNLLALQEITISFGALPVLNRIDLNIEEGQKICLVGRNGEGKSTLLKLIAGDLQPDSGRMIKRSGLKTAMLSQDVPHEIAGTIYDVVAGGLGESFELLRRHHAISLRLAEKEDPGLLDELMEVEHGLEAAGGWHARQRIETVLSHLELNADLLFNELSGGLRRRVMLARALVNEPELLLLDEPTNHLDIDSIAWLEEFLKSSAGTIIFITHDRMLAGKLADRILDLDRGKITSWPGSMGEYLRKKDELLEVEALHQKKFDKKLSQEETWIRQGIKARRTRNEGRVRALIDLRNERSARREKIGKATMKLHEADISGKLVAKAENISFRFGQSWLVKDFSTTVLRGDKVGILGPNGCGKTTLIKILFGELVPETGSVHLGSKIQLAYSDQLRSKLDEDKTVAENVGEGKETVTINGFERHIISYLKDFLFTPDRARSPVSILSGGERNRLMLAKLFCRPANVLVLDEPTNDLDVESLELLEEILLDFKGTVILVSHDRAFLNNVVTSTFVFEGNGKVQEYAGGYDDWLMQRPVKRKNGLSSELKKKEKAKLAPSSARKLTFKEERELEGLHKRIEEMEAEQSDLLGKMADGGFFQRDGDAISKAKNRLQELEQDLARSYFRWEALEAIKEEYMNRRKS